MKNIIAGASLFLSGCIIFSFCILYSAFQGCVPSDVQGERVFSIILLVVGGCLMGYELLKGKLGKQ